MATGNARQAEELVDGLQERIAATADSVPPAAQGLSVYHELDPTL